MKLNNLMILGAIGLGAWYFLNKQNIPTTTPDNVITTPTPSADTTTTVGAIEVRPPIVNSGVDSQGRLVTAPIYIPSNGYVTSYTASGNEIRTTTPSYANAGTDPLMKVVTEVGGGQHLAFSNKGSTADTREASRQANIQDLKNRGLW
jgi:hypothetical protein